MTSTKQKVTVIEIDETKDLFGFEDTVKKFYSVYFFDPEQFHFACSAEKLYWLNGLYFNVETHPGVSGDERDAVENELHGIADIVRDQYACAYQIKHLIKSGQARTVQLEFDAEDTEDDIRDHLCGNHLL